MPFAKTKFKEMSAPIGNQYWMKRAVHGRKRKFTTPEALRLKAIAYFQWCDQCQAYKSRYARYKRKDFFRFAGIGVATFTRYQDREGYKEIHSGIINAFRKYDWQDLR